MGYCVIFVVKKEWISGSGQELARFDKRGELRTVIFAVAKTLITKKTSRASSTCASALLLRSKYRPSP